MLSGLEVFSASKNVSAKVPCQAALSRCLAEGLLARAAGQGCCQGLLGQGLLAKRNPRYGLFWHGFGWMCEIFSEKHTYLKKSYILMQTWAHFLWSHEELCFPFLLIFFQYFQIQNIFSRCLMTWSIWKIRVFQLNVCFPFLSISTYVYMCQDICWHVQNQDLAENVVFKPFKKLVGGCVCQTQMFKNSKKAATHWTTYFAKFQNHDSHYSVH